MTGCTFHESITGVLERAMAASALVIAQLRVDPEERLIELFAQLAKWRPSMDA